MLETFMNAKYEKVLDGRKFTETEVAGMLLALLLAGQHSSSTVSSWLGFFIAYGERERERKRERERDVEKERGREGTE